MKLLERNAQGLSFSLGSREKTLLERLLTFYPLRDENEPTLSREGGEKFREATLLLREGLREQRSELAEWIRRRLVEGQAFRPGEGGWRLSLEGSEPEHLLQVFNELRVGAWTKLGCPEELNDEAFATTPGRAPLYVIMTLAGEFEMVLVHALLGTWGAGEDSR
jgi:hypothetical protein